METDEFARRSPVLAATQRAAWARWSVMWSRNARSCWAFQALATELPAHGVIERSSQDLVDLEHRLGVEPTVMDSIALHRQVRVHALDVIGSQVTQRDPPNPGAT